MGVYGLGAGRDLYRATPVVTQVLGFMFSSVGLSHLVTIADKRGAPWT